MTEDHVYPEDQGTNDNLNNVGEGDDADAANFASVFEAIGSTDFVVRGLDVTLDEENNQFDLTAGKVVVTDESAFAAQTSEIRDQSVAYIAEVGERTGIEYVSNEVNHVFVDVLLTDDDALDIVVNTTDSQPDEPSLKIAEIDDT